MNSSLRIPPGGRPSHTIAALLAAGLIGSAAFAAPLTDALDQLMALLRQRQHGHVAFTERHITSVLDRPLESSGELFYDAPARLEKHTIKPRSERLVLENGQLNFERHHRTYHVALADYPQAAPYIDSIRATLAGDRPALERVFQVAFSESGADWMLALTPLAAPLAAELLVIRIEGSSAVIRTVSVQWVNGDRSVMTLGTSLDP